MRFKRSRRRSAIRVRPLGQGDLERALVLLLRDPLYNTLVLANIVKRGIGEREGALGGQYVGVWQGERLIGMACAYGIGSFLGYVAEKTALAPIARYCEKAGIEPTAIVGRPLEVQYFSGRFFSESEPVELREDFMRLDRADTIPVPGPPARPARTEDLEAIVELQRRMESEIFGIELSTSGSTREVLAGGIEAGSVFVCEEAGRVVAKANSQAVIKGVWHERAGYFSGAQVGGVYTEPESRGRGYSTSCVGSLCHNLLESVEVVTLAAVKGNGASQRVYGKLGFRTIGEWMIAFSRGS